MVQNADLGVGALLRSRREELGHDTDSVARQLRIRAIYIRAIEEGRMRDLPGTAYAVGFVRTYADFLGFDGNSVVDNYRDEIGQRGRPEPVNWQLEDKDGGFPFGRLFIILLVIAAAGYGLWYYLANTQSGTDLIEAVPEYLKKSTTGDKPATPPASGSSTTPAAPSTTAAPAGSSSQAAPVGNATPAQQATGTAAESTANPAGGGGNAGAQATTNASMPTTDQTLMNGQAAISASTSSATPAAPQGQAAGVTMPATPSQPGTAQLATTIAQSTLPPPTPNQTASVPVGGEASPDVAAAATSATTRISVKAKLESWVQINDREGKPVLSRVLRAGEVYAVPDQKGLVMDTGNAGGIEVVVDGKTMPSLGSVGLVKRNIMLDPDKLATGDANKAPAKIEPADGNGGTTPTGD